MNLTIAANLTKFANMLDKIETTDRISNGVLTNWEREFVADIRERFDARADQEDLGLTPWSPSVNQYNTLHGIWSKL